MENISKQYDQFVDRYREGKAPVSNNEARMFVLDNLVDPTGIHLLDLGCGGGEDARIYEGLGATVYGVDTSEKMIAVAKSNVLRPENFHVANMEHVPFAERSFDAVVSCYGIHYLDKFEQLFRECARVLKPGGLFLFIAHHPLRDLELQKERRYGEQEIATLELFDTKVVLTFPTHTFADYLCPAFFEHFDMRAFKEGIAISLQSTDGLPDYIAVKATKRE